MYWVTLVTKTRKSDIFLFYGFFFKRSSVLFCSFCRFSQLKSLNLSHNRLGVFPECVCEVLTLTELNLSCNSLQTIPVQIGNLQRCDTVIHIYCKCILYAHYITTFEYIQVRICLNKQYTQNSV